MKSPNKIKMLLALPIMIALGHLSLPAQAKEKEGGHFVGNGGDAVEQNGELVMRDFLNSGRLSPVIDNVTFLKSIPDFIPLLKEIAQTSPRLAKEIWIDLKNVKIWTTQAKLPILPATDTAVITTEKAEVQYAIRYKNDIVISLPDFKRIEQSYGLAHESMHEVIKQGENESLAWHHEMVRSFVNYLKENRGNYPRALNDDVLSKFGFYSGSKDDLNSKLLLNAFLTNRGEATYRCAVYNDVYKLSNITSAVSYTFSSMVSSGLFDQFVNINCKEESYESAINDLYPNLNANLESLKKLPFAYGVYKEPPLYQCKQYADPKTLQAYKQAANVFASLPIDQMQADANTGNDLAKRILITAKLTEIKAYDALKETREKISKGITDTQSSIDRCVDEYGKNYMKKSE